MSTASRNPPKYPAMSNGTARMVVSSTTPIESRMMYPAPAMMRLRCPAPAHRCRAGPHDGNSKVLRPRH